MSVEFNLKIGKNHQEQVQNKTPQDGLFFQGNNGSTVILIHGLTGTPNEMGFLARFFNKKGYTVVCPRLANHGKPLEVLKKTKWQDCYASVRQAFLNLPKGNNKIFVSGLSMGAILALLLVCEFPDDVAGVSCLSPTLFYDGWNVPWVQNLLPIVCLTPLKHFLYFKEESPYGIKNKRLREYVHKHYSKAKLNSVSDVDIFGYPYFPVALLDQLRLLVKHVTARLSEVITPVQLVQAREDDMTSIKNSQFIYDKVASKQKEIVLLDNCYHVVTADQERDKVAENMEIFFTSIRG